MATFNFSEIVDTNDEQQTCRYLIIQQTQVDLPDPEE